MRLVCRRCESVENSTIHKDGWEVVYVPHCFKCKDDPKPLTRPLDKLRKNSKLT